MYMFITTITITVKASMHRGSHVMNRQEQIEKDYRQEPVKKPPLYALCGLKDGPD